jgi:fumarate hydratase, class II
MVHSILRDACRSFSEVCVQGIEANRKHIQENVENSLVAALNEYIGYDKAAKLAKTTHQKGISLHDANRELGFLMQEDF